MQRILHLRSTGAFLGAESVVLELCAMLPEFEYECSIGLIHDSRDPDPELAQRATDKGLSVEVFEARKRIDTNCISQIKAHTADLKPNIIHCHGYREDLYALAAKTGCPLVATNHLWKKANLTLRAYAFLDSLALSQFSAIAAVSTPILQEMKQFFYLSKKNMTVIPNGVDTTVFNNCNREQIRHKLELAPSTVAIGTISSLSTVKGHRYLIQALADPQMLNHDWRLFVVGDGPLQSELKQLCSNNDLENKIRFLGARNDIPALLAGLDIFALPSLKEGLPMALLEAMAAGKACIASSVGEIPTVLNDPKAGIMTPPEDVQALVAALKRLLNDSSLIQSMGQEAKQLVINSYSARAMAAKYADLYSEVLSK